MTFKRIMLARRRVDPWLLAAGMLCIAMYLPPAVAIAGLFGVMGLYVAFSKRRRLVQLAKSPIGFVFAYIVWVMLLLLWRNDLSLQSNRQLGFIGLLLGLAFIAPGLSLVRQPLRWLVIGARLGTVAGACAALMAMFVLKTAGERYDGGGNAAIVAIVALLGGIAAIIPIDRPWRYLPNGPAYLVIAAIPVFLSETRAVMVVLPLILAVEFAYCSLRWRPRWRNRAYLSSAAGISLLLLFPSVQHLLVERFGTVYEYYVEGQRAHDMESGNIRLALWDTSIKVISQHPFIGVGIRNTFPELEKVAGQELSRVEGGKHVHNFVLQELLANGLIGLMLLLAIFASVTRLIVKDARYPELKRASFYYFGSIVIFGLLHDPFYHELCMSSTMLFLGVLIAQTDRWRGLTDRAPRTM